MHSITTSALLFDMDGVLINSIPTVVRVWRRWAIEHGFDPDEVVKLAHGRPSITTVRELLPNADAEAENRIIEQQEIADVAGVAPLPGARELLLALPPQRWAIVTSCTRPLAEVRIRTAGLPQPSLLLTSSDIVHGKPHPEPYLKAAKLLGFSARDCIVVEDVPAGIQAGKSAGARVLALRTTTSEDELKAAQPDWISNNLTDVHLLIQPSSNKSGELALRLS
jgi:sugar-phosphatase